MARFLKMFFDVPATGDESIDKMVQLIFEQYDTNQNGIIEKKEAF